MSGKGRAAENESGKEKTSPEEPVSAEELQALREKAAKAGEYWERILHLSADFENTKKRLEKRSQETAKYANDKLVLEILPVVDDLDRAMASLDQGHELQKVKEGLHLAQNNFHRILEQNGVQVITAAGEDFDPNLHEAVGEVVTDAVEEGRVAEEIQKGYTLHGRLVRPSRVKIAKKKT